MTPPPCASLSGHAYALAGRPAPSRPTNSRAPWPSPSTTRSPPPTSLRPRWWFGRLPHEALAACEDTLPTPSLQVLAERLLAHPIPELRRIAAHLSTPLHHDLPGDPASPKLIAHPLADLADKHGLRAEIAGILDAYAHRSASISVLSSSTSSRAPTPSAAHGSALGGNLRLVVLDNAHPARTSAMADASRLRPPRRHGPTDRLAPVTAATEYDLDPGDLPLPARPTPATLLCASFRGVDFASGLHAEVAAELLAWYREPASFAVLVVVGPAGAGKTRLLLEHCIRLRADGWHAGFIPAATTPRTCAILRPTCMILDYADVQPRLYDHLAAWRAAARPEGPPLRIVLLARALGEWWTTLADEPRLATLIGRATIVALAAPAEPARAGLAAAAVTQLAARLGRTPPATVPPVGSTTGPLWILAAALRSVLGETSGGEPFEAIVNHEARVWKQAMQHHLASDRLARRFDRHARVIVAALTLRGGAANEQELVALIKAVAGTGYREFALVLRELYPDDIEAGRWVRPLAPELLGEVLVKQVLDRYGHEFERMLTGTFDEQANHVAQMLLRTAQRAAADRSFARRWLERLLAHDLPTFAPPVVSAILGASPDPTAASWVASLAAVLDTSSDQELAHRLLARIPEHTTALVRVGVWAGQTVGRWLPPLDNRGWTLLRADVHARTAHFLLAEGDMMGAALWSGLEIDALDALAGADPALNRRLAVCMRNRGAIFMAAREYIAALELIDQCIEVCRKIASIDPGARTDGLVAACLDHRGIIFGNVGLHALAIATTEESVSLYRDLATEAPEFYRRELAAALDNLGGRYRQTGEFVRSLEVTEEALAIYRSQTEVDPDLVLRDFLLCLNAAASRRAKVGDLERAAEAIEEAIERLRPLSEHHPELRGMLATSLSNAAAIHRGLGRAEQEAAEAAELAALVDEQPDDTAAGAGIAARIFVCAPGGPEYELATPGGRLALPPELAVNPSLRADDHNVRSRVLHHVGAHAEALAEAEAAVAALANAPGELVMHRLTLLNNLANRQADAGHLTQARDTTAQLLASLETLAAVDEQSARGLAAIVRGNLAVRYCELDDPHSGLPLATAAVDELQRYLVDDSTHADSLDRALAILARCLTDIGETTAASAAMAEADRIRAQAVELHRAALGLAAPVPTHTWRMRLHELLTGAFTPEQLRAWIAVEDTSGGLQAALPAPPCSPNTLVSALVEEGERRGIFDHGFFMRLHAWLPRRTLQIGLILALKDTAYPP